MRGIRGSLVALLLLSVGLLPGTAQANLVFVLNSGEASISLLDAARREQIRRIPVLREPHHLVLTPDGRSLVVGDSAGNELLFFDPATGELQRRERISNPYHLDFSPDGRWLVIASLRRGQIDIYEAPGEDGGLRLVRRHRFPHMPSHMAFSPDSRTVYLTLQGAGRVVAISLETMEVLWQAEVGPEPAGILWHRGQLIVGIMGRDHFAVLDPELRQVVRTIPIGRGAHAIFAAPGGQVLWATSRVDSRVAAIDPESLRVLQVFEIPGGPDCLAFDAEGRVWMTLRWVGRVGRLDPETGQVETIRVGRSPHGIFVHWPRGAEGPAAPPSAQR
ncbi:YVTN family beta-propeller repeat protein [Crenalkalicoccus roseus]|uniref:YVTN family beta-propeller repeat protein n=1 Tax=Crenalkalicoccus roseus TaxID=1485588 RepID=UPI001081E0C0|nr:beta-propeller fold lactonase family protein [Crenalkalicoccus roseus]